ncbi:MAG: hypothetical protein ABIM29_03625 [candidate division WOR-3 bacterium]
MKKFLVIFLFLSSCMTMNVFEGPDTTKKGETSFGLGVSNFVLFDESGKPIFMPIPFPYLKGRYGVTDNLDIGFRYVGILGFGFDPKIKFLDKGIKGSLTLPFNITKWPEVPIWYSFEPTLILGTNLIYFGSKFSYLSLQLEWDNETSNIYGIFPSLFLGFTLGKNWKLCPEVNFYLPATIGIGEKKGKLWRPAISYGIGIFYMPK